MEFLEQRPRQAPGAECFIGGDWFRPAYRDGNTRVGPGLRDGQQREDDLPAILFFNQKALFFPPGSIVQSKYISHPRSDALIRLDAFILSKDKYKKISRTINIAWLDVS